MSHEPTSSEPAAARFGPFHRLASDTQTLDVARTQKETCEIWGLPARTSGWPQVRAYRAVLPAASFGIEFYTDVPPDDVGGSTARWSGPEWNGAARIEGDFAKIDVVITIVRYPEGQQ